MSSRLCAVCVCVNWCRLRCLKLGMAFWSSALLTSPVDVAWVGVGCPPPQCDLWPLLCPLHWPDRGCPGWFSQLRTQVECWAQSGCRRGSVYEGLLIVRGGFAAHMQEVGCVVVGGVVECPFGVVQAVLYYWHCLWTSSGWSKLLSEWPSLRNRMVLLWVCPAPSLLT